MKRLRSLAANALVAAFVLAPDARLVSAGPGHGAMKPASTAPILRKCADPENLPYSDEHGAGFEDAIARTVADELGMRVETFWWAERRGFFRNTLGSGACDVVVGVPRGLEHPLTTNPIYSSSLAFVTLDDRHLDLHSLDDPRLAALSIGVPVVGDDGANPPPAAALARRRIIANVHGYPVYADRGRALPAAVEDVEKGVIDVAILWGPIAGAASRHSEARLRVTPIDEQQDGEQPLAFDISMGVKKGNRDLATRLEGALARRAGEIETILSRAGVPLRKVP
jgi:mxaJ protein